MTLCESDEARAEVSTTLAIENPAPLDPEPTLRLRLFRQLPHSGKLVTPPRRSLSSSHPNEAVSMRI